MSSKKVRSKKEEQPEEAQEEDDAPIHLELNPREVHTLNWVKKEGKKVVQEYFDCEPFNIGEEDGETLFLTNDVLENEGVCPTGDEPQALNSFKFIDETYEQSIPKLILNEEARGKFFTMMAGFSVSYALGFAFVMMRFGGYFFLIPFTISTILITFPINFAQYSLGQYTNMPPIVLYSRMSPIYLGVGFMVVMVQYLSSASIRFNHRFISMTFELVYSVTAEQLQYDGRSRIKGIMNGFSPNCPSGHYLRENQCLPDDHSNYRFGRTDREYIQEKIRANLQSDQFIRDYATAVTPPDRIFDPMYQTAHYISAATVLSIFLFFLSLLWVKTYFKRIQGAVFFGSILLCTVTMTLLVTNWGRQATILVGVIGGDFSKLLEIKTWVMAAIHSLIVFGTVDGSYLAIGASNSFSNHLLFDLIRAKIGGILLLLLFSTTFGMMTLVGAGIWTMKVEKRELTVDDFRVLIYNDSQVFEFIYVYFFQNMTHKMLMLVFMTLFCFWEMAGLMLMAEGSISTIYRFFKSAARLPQFIIRYISLTFHCTLVFFVHFIMHGLHQLPYLLAPYVVLIQVLSFSLINYQLFFTIVITLNRRYRTVFYKNRKKIRVYYRYILSAMVSGLIFFEIYSNGFRHAKTCVLPVVIVGCFQIFRYKFISVTWKSWRPTGRFKPVFYHDFDEFKRQDKGLNGKTEIKEEDWERRKNVNDKEIYEMIRNRTEPIHQKPEEPKFEYHPHIPESVYREVEVDGKLMYKLTYE